MNIKIATADMPDSSATSSRPSPEAAQGSSEVQARPDQQHSQLLQVARIAILISGAALVGWVPSSIGAANDNAPARFSAAPAQAGGALETAAGSSHESSDRPTRPTCADVGASTPELEITGEFRGAVAVGCGIGGNVAGGTPASDQIKEPQVDAGRARLAARAIYWLRRSNPL